MPIPSIPSSKLPNLITASRLAALPFLWLLAATGASRPLAVGIVLVASTDVLDGWLARTRDSRTELGSRMDSIADHLLTASVLGWLLWLRPEFIQRHLTLLALWAGFGAFTLLVGWLRFRRIGDLHLYSAKAAGVLSYTLVFWLLFFDAYPPALFAVAIAACYVATTECLLVYLTRKDPAERIGSILLRGRGETESARRQP